MSDVLVNTYTTANSVSPITLADFEDLLVTRDGVIDATNIAI